MLLPLLAQNPALSAIRAHPTGLPHPWLVAGCLAQTVWNLQSARPPAAGITDYDLVYHDPTDLSAESEAAHEARLRAALGLRLDVKNQARVHLWYPARFGKTIAPYPSVPAAIDTYPTTATAIGLNLITSEVYATFGLADLLAGRVRPNRRLATPEVYAAKTARWASQWPALRIEPWEAGGD